MYRIGNSKSPSVRQLSHMASNLRYKYKVYATIHITCSAYATFDHDNTVYWINVEKEYADFIHSWPETLAKYRKLMSK